MNIRRIAALGGALVVLGVAATAVTVVQAQTAPTPTPTTRQNVAEKYTQALATRLHVTVDQLKQAMQDARKDAGLPEPGTRPAPGMHRGAGPGGPGGAARPGGFGFGFRGLLGQQADAVAGLFKEDRAALLAELGGKTLAEVAATHNVSTQDLVNTIVTTGNEQIDRMAQARNLSADQVRQMKQKMSERVQEFVTTHRFPARGSGIRS
jgi:hypothetical protein